MSDFKNDFNSARARIGGLKGVMRVLGDAPDHDHKWASMTKCPFCGAKDCSGLWEKDGTEFFKCHKPGCSSSGVAMTEVGYIAAREGLSDTKPATGGASPAYERFLKLAGCWEVLADGHPAPAPGTPKEVIGAEMVDRAAALVLARRDASVRMLMVELKVGSNTAGALLAALEKRGVVGPWRDKAPREIILKDLPATLDDQPAEEQAGVPAAAGVRDGSVLPSEQNVAGSHGQPGNTDPVPVSGAPAAPIAPALASNGGVAPSGTTAGHQPAANSAAKRGRGGPVARRAGGVAGVLRTADADDITA